MSRTRVMTWRSASCSQQRSEEENEATAAKNTTKPQPGQVGSGARPRAGKVILIETNSNKTSSNLTGETHCAAEHEEEAESEMRDERLKFQIAGQGAANSENRNTAKRNQKSKPGSHR